MANILKNIRRKFRNMESKNEENNVEQGTEHISDTENKTENNTAETKNGEELSEKAVYEAKIAELNDKYLRLYSEFDNFRKRTARERIDLIGTAASDTIKSFLPVIDDFERAMKSIEQAKDINALNEGVQLIHKRFVETLTHKGLKEMDVMEKTFDPEFQEAITKIPAPKEELKGKVVDVVEKGYFLHDKVIRYAKVVIGE